MKNYKCEKCQTESMVIISKPMSQDDKKRGTSVNFIICKNCDPVMASFHCLEDGFKELQLAIKANTEKK